jgi:hypothetical protein
MMNAEKAKKIDYCNSINTPKLLPALVLSLTFAIPLFAADARSDDIIDGKFTIQPYLLPDGQGYRHVTGGYDRDRNEYIFFGGISNGSP